MPKRFINDDAVEVKKRFQDGAAIITGQKDYYLQSDDAGGSTDNTEAFTGTAAQLTPASLYTQAA